MKRTKLIPIRWACFAAILALPLTQSVVHAQDRAKPGVTDTEMKYQAGDSPLGKVDMHQNISPQAPPMTKVEFEQAKEIYFQRSTP